MKWTPRNLKREFRQLFRCMGFVARHPALKAGGKEAERFAEIYQQLGQLWEFLALQCRHTEGWRKTRDGNHACKVCGTIRGAAEQWTLLSSTGKKVIGRRLLPNSSQTFPNKKAATLIEDAIEFHGAKVRVDVHNSYRSRLFARSKLDISVAAERSVHLEESGIECSIDLHLVSVKLVKHKRGQRPPYGAFLSELPKRALERFPLLVEYNDASELVGVTIFRPAARSEARDQIAPSQAAAKTVRRRSSKRT